MVDGSGSQESFGVLDGAVVTGVEDSVKHAGVVDFLLVRRYEVGGRDVHRIG